MTIERIPNQQDLSWFIDMYNGKKLELNPPYQRRSVWTSKDRKFFLDTIFNNYPCPAIYLQKQINDIGTVFNVVDGKQRLQTVLDFYENKLRMAKDFPDPNLANKRWKDIEKNSHYRSIFLNYRFSVEQLTSDIDDDGWNSVFDRVNRNQKTLTEQELRHAKFNGWFINFVEEEAEDTVWRDLKISSKTRITRMKNVEFVSLLALAILERDFIGFPQYKLDEYYAKYDFELSELKNDDDLEEDDTQISLETIESFKDNFYATKQKVERLMKNDSLKAIISVKLFTYFYTLWTLVAFEDLSEIEESDLISNLIKFYSEVSKIKDIDQVVENADIKDFYINSIGAATETEYRRKRHFALKHYLLG